MKKLLALAWLLGSLFPLFAQKAPLSLYHIRHNWSKKEYRVCAPGEKATVESCVLAFAEPFQGFPLLDALSARIRGDVTPDIPVADFLLDRVNGYALIRLDKEELAESEARLWTLPDGQQVFVIKFVDHADPTSEQICFCHVDTAQGILKRRPSPDGFRHGYIDNLLLSRSGREIEVKWQYQPADKMVLQDDGEFVYQEFAPNAIGCYLVDPDPITNVRATPGGKVIVRLGEKKPSRQANEDDDWFEETGVYTFTVYNPQNGWWQILDYYVGGVRIEDQAWIHSSVLGLHTRNYGGQPLNLYASPSEDAPVVATIREEAADVRPLDVNADGSWVKVKAKAGTGWIHRNWLCDNPLTNCS